MKDSNTQTGKQQQEKAITYCSPSYLLQQNALAQLLSQKIRLSTKQIPLHTPQTGQHLSTYKGQGMNYAESRNYQPGDDIRYIDWRATARTGVMHTKIFTEQREKPVMLVVDMRQPMFFGTQQYYKSVLAARIASLIAWKNFNSEDKTGLVIFPANGSTNIQLPAFSQQAITRLIKQLAKATQTVNFSKTKTTTSLTAFLHMIGKTIKAGSQITILSDFRGIDNDSLQQFINLSKKSSLALFSISDPFENELAAVSRPTSLPNKLPLTNGQNRISLDSRARENYSRLHQARQHCLEHLSHQANIQLTEFSTSDRSTQLLAKLVSFTRRLS